MRVIIIGSGIAGLVCAHLLAADHQVTLFEAGDHVGGHTHTHDVCVAGKPVAVDTGFIVFNTWTYPRFTRLLAHLGVESRASNMSFGVRDERSGFEYAATDFHGFFADRRLLLSPGHYRLVYEIVRFGRTARRALRGLPSDVSLRELLQAEGYGAAFRDRFIVPMAAAIWSSPQERVLDGPAHFFVRFFDNHAMLSVVDQPVWRTIVGGSRSYIEPLAAPFRQRVFTRTAVQQVRRSSDGVQAVLADGHIAAADHVIFACHSDQALGLLELPSVAEREVLSAMPYQKNEAVLHTDERLLPRRRRARAAWNYHVDGRAKGPVAVTYDMNRLQGLDAPETLCVTLNRSDQIDPGKVLRRMDYQHPVYSQQAVRAQARFAEISGIDRTHFAGAYWYNGFHEDGVRSALRVARRFGKWLA
jgi:predicted NAD/FAD-binding protein